MKKLLAVLLALVIVGGAFAQATVNGYVRSRAVITEDAFSLANQRVRLNLGWTSEDKNVVFGARTEMSWDGKTTSFLLDDNALDTNDTNTDPDKLTVTGTDLAVKYAYGKIMLADGMVAVSGGMLTIGDYEFASGISEYTLGNVANGGSWWALKGMAVQLFPMDGLNIGVLAMPDGNKFGVEQFNLGVAYTLEGIGDFLAHIDFVDPTADSALTAGFKYTGVEGLGITAGYMGLVETAAFGIVNYEMDALTAEVAGTFNLDTEAMYVESTIQYMVNDNLKVLGLFGYDKDGWVLGNQDDNEPSNFIVGGEILYTVGKGLIGFYPTFDDFAGFSLPIAVKVSF